MLSFSKKIRSIVLGFCVLISSSFTVNAAIIQQDILAVLEDGSSGVLGAVTFEIKDSLIGTDLLLDTAFGDPGFSVKEISILGNTEFEFFDLNASIFTAGIFGGLESLQFDLLELTARAWSISGSFDVFADPTTNVFDIFAGTELVTFGTFQLGDVRFVSVPSTAGLMLLMGLFVLARKQKNAA